jgi:outer membrane protein TolC
LDEGDAKRVRYNGSLARIAAGELPVKLNRFLCAILFAPCAVLSAQHAVTIPTPLAVLLAEAQANNSQVASAADNWKASTHVAQQVTALPDPQFTIQSLSNGSPRPFAGIGNSDWTYIGLAASQDLPYKGKLKLRGEVANREAETQKDNIEVVRSSVAEQVKLLYLQLSYSSATLASLDRTDSLLQSLIQDAISRYSLGQGSQSAVLKAQMERTQLLRQETMHNLTLGQTQARLKQLLHRPQESADILTDPLAATPFTMDIEELQSQLRNRNPKLRVDADAVEKQNAQLASAKLGAKPDFSVGYQLQLTGSDYSDRYVLSVNMRLPNRGRVAGEIAEAVENANRTRHELDSEAQQTLAELQEEYVAVKSTTELMSEYKQGLIPQADAVFHSEQSAYRANKQELTPVLSSLLDMLNLETEYQQVLFDHEAALVRIETLTGGTLR